MSGTASRFQGRFGYDPILRVGLYPAAPPPPVQAPVPGGVSTVRPAPVSGVTPPVATNAAPVMAGSMNPDLLRLGGGDVGTGVGGPGPMGAPSTGSVLGDIAAVGNAVGPALGAFGSPMGVAGLGLGAIASGAAAAFGLPGLSSSLASMVGLQGPPVPYGGNSGDPFGGIPSDVAAAHGLGHDMGVGGDSGFGGAPGDNANSNSDAQGQGGLGNDGTGAGGAGMGAGAPGNDSGMGDYMRGGYTGAGPDGAVQPQKIAGRVHEGEVVIPAAQVARYGIDPLLMLARGQVAPSRLAALLRG